MALSAVLVDIGNRRLKVAPFDTGDREAVKRMEWKGGVQHWDAESPGDWLRPKTDARLTWWVSSVHRATAERFQEWIGRVAPQDVVRLLYHVDFPLTIDLPEPERVGIDRLAAATGALTLEQPPLIVVDAGTAITVDLVLPPCRFAGGAILPGMALMAESLAAGTDALPPLESFDGDDDGPGRDTRHAMRLGIRAATMGGIERLVGCFRASCGDDRCPVLLTGGNGPALTAIDSGARFHPELVLRGVARAARRACGPST